jgi:hypothetical protein
VVPETSRAPHAATDPDTAEADTRSRARPRDSAALTGALSILLIVAAFVVWGNTPKGDATGAEVFSHYADNRTQGLIAAALLALSAIPVVAFAAALRERARMVLPRSMLPSFAFGAGVVAAAGFLGAAGIHFALADFGRDIDPAAAQALNTLDADSFVVFTAGLSGMVLAGSLIALRTWLLPAWLGGTGIIIAIAIFTPVGFFASCAAGAWIILISAMLYLGGETTPGPSSPAPGARRRAPTEPATS